MQKLILPPSNSAYGVTDGLSVVATKLDGGASRFRRDILNAASTVDVVWVTNSAGFEYLRTFFRGVTIGGSLPFLIDLIIDYAALTEHRANFLPGTFKLTEQRGLSYTVTAQLEVMPQKFAINDMEEIQLLYAEFGADWTADESVFSDLVNVEIPEDYL